MSLVAAPQTQWSLDNSAGGLISLARGLIQAATSDNVQMLALLACEQFGTTLPINTTTRVKVELLARQSRSRSLNFLKPQVGFSSGDSADVLSRSDGGVRFLCLASILVSWGVSGITSAELLESLIQDTAKEDQPLPTLLQLMDLFQVLTPKLIKSGLTKDVLGWYYWMGESEMTWQTTRLHKPLIAPGVNEMRLFINALRRCFRLGEESTTVCIDAAFNYVPFTIAVTKWLLGKPPVVRRPDRSTWLDSDLTGICINASRADGHFLVSTKHTIDSMEQLISVEGQQGPGGRYDFMRGLIETHLWTRIRLEGLELHSDLCGQVILYHQIPGSSSLPV